MRALRLPTSIVFAAALTLWIVAPAYAASTLGQTNSNISCSGNFVFEQTATTGGLSYTVPAAGTITSWSTVQPSPSSTSMSLLVFRAGVVVATDGPHAISAGTNTFSVNIPVQAGDTIGSWISGHMNCIGTAAVGDNVAFNNTTPSTPSIGSTPSFPISLNGYSVNLSATFQLAATGPPPESHGAYCAATPVLRADGTIGTFVDLADGQPANDPAYTGATRAEYGQGYGLTCDDLAGLGYADAGYKVDESGTHTGDPVNDVYEYFLKE